MKPIFYTLVVLFSFTCLPSFSQSGGWTQVSANTKMDFDGIYFFDNLNGFIGGGFGSTYATTNGGKTWSKTPNQGYRDYDFYDNKYGYGASISGQAMGYTTNGGTGWTKITPPTSNSLWAVAATGARSAYFSGTGGVLWKTENGGITVKVLKTGTLNLIPDVHFFDDDEGIIVKQREGLSKTTTGGFIWKTVYNNTNQDITFGEMHFVDSKLGFVVGNEQKKGGFLLKTTDGGNNWSRINVHEKSHWLYGVDFYDEDHGLVVGLKGDIYYTNDGGKNWNRQLADKDSTNLNDVHMFSESSAIIIGNNGMILLHDAIKIVSNTPEQKALSVNVFPNPVQEYVMVQSDEMLNKVEILNAQGQVCQSTHFESAGSVRVDIAHLSKGIYTVVASTESKRTVTRIIKT